MLLRFEHATERRAESVASGDIVAHSTRCGAEFLPDQELCDVTKYRYVYSNSRVMLVDPATRTVVHEID